MLLEDDRRAAAEHKLVGEKRLLEVAELLQGVGLRDAHVPTEGVLKRKEGKWTDYVVMVRREGVGVGREHLLRPSI